MRSTCRAFTLMQVLSAIAALSTLALEPVVVLAAARTVSFRSPSGRTVEASLNESSQRPATAVVLVGMLGHSRDDWQAIAQRMADAHITTLAIDLPGAVAPGDPGALANWSDDIRGAVAYLASRPETRAGAIGVVGAALGASLAGIAAAGDSQIRSLVLVSPTSDYRGVRLDNALRQYGARPAYLVASQQDPYAARSARELAKNPPGIRQVQMAEAAASGTSLLIREPDLVRLVIEWFQRTLG